MNTRQLLALGIFLFVYVIISARQIRWINLNRPAGVLLGALLVVATGVLPLDEAYAAVDLNTLGLLLGTMVVVAYLERAHFFPAVASRVLSHARTPRRLLAGLIAASAALSAFFVNDTICLLLTPIVLEIVDAAGLPPIPYLLALAMSANVGSAVTLIGNPQNMLIAVYSGLPFPRYFLYALPVGLAGLAAIYAVLLLLYRRDLPLTPIAVPQRHHLPAPYRKIIVRLLAVVVVFLLMLFLPVERLLHIEARQKLPFVALIAGELAILAGRFRPDHVLKLVDWSLLLFFTGLFVVIHGVQASGLMETLHDALRPWFHSTPATQIAAFSGLTLVGSNLVSNVPYVMIAKSWMHEFAEGDTMWALLALVSTFAGNLTIIGSVANIIVLEKSKDAVTIDFWTYLKAGVPVTLATCALAALWCYCVPF